MSLGAEPVAILVWEATQLFPAASPRTGRAFRWKSNSLPSCLIYSHSHGTSMTFSSTHPSFWTKNAWKHQPEVQCLREFLNLNFLPELGPCFPFRRIVMSTFLPFRRGDWKSSCRKQNGNRTGRDAKFVCVYLYLLKALENLCANVASVVERASAFISATTTVLTQLKGVFGFSGSECIGGGNRKIRGLSKSQTHCSFTRF